MRHAMSRGGGRLDHPLKAVSCRLCEKPDPMTERSNKDPLARSLVLLRLIPRYPRSVSTVELRDALQTEGFQINVRSLQRDLAGKLSTLFQLVCSSEDSDPAIRRMRPYRWSFAATAQTTVPAISPAAALAMNMAEAHLRQVLPPAVMDLLDPQFTEARELLQTLEKNELSQWARRVRAVPSVKPLVPAKVEPQVWDGVSQGLLRGHVLRVRYLSRTKTVPREMDLHPAGLASRGASTYLIARVAGFADFRHFALQRLHGVTVLDEVADDHGFDMDDYLKSAAFSPRGAGGELALDAEVHPQLGWALAETPLAHGQQLLPIAGSEWLRLQVQVPDDQEMATWLLAQAERIRISAPAALREQIASRLEPAARWYACGAA